MGDGVQLGSAYGVIEIDASGVRQGVQQAEQSLGGLGRQFGMIGAALSLGVTAPLAAVGKKALDTAMDFQSSMAMFQAVSGATAGQMEQVRRAAVDLGADMTLPATSAADAGLAMTELAKAGLSVKEAMAAAQGTLQLAAAGQLSEAQAAQITANALNTFGLAGTEAARVADMLAAGANASSASVGDLAAGLQQGGFAFKAAGLTVDELVTSVAALTNVGLTGSDAGTALKNAIIKLAAPTKDGAELMHQLGIDVFDAHGKMLPMPGVIDAFNKGMAGMTQEQRLAALSTIVLSDGAKALLPLLDLGAQGFSDLQGQVTKSGAAQELAAAQMAGLRGALLGLGSQLETVGLVIATRLLPTFESIVRKVADVVAAFSRVSPNIQNAVLAFLAVLAAAGPVIAAIGAIAAALAFLMSPIGLAVAAVALLAAAFAGDFLGIRTRVEAVIDNIRNFMTVVQDAGLRSSEAWEAMTLLMGERMATLVQNLVGAFDVVRAAFTGDFAAIRGRLGELQLRLDEAFGPGTTGKLMAFGRDAGMAFGQVREYVLRGVEAFGIFRAGLTGNFDAVRGRFSEMQQGIDETFGAGTTAKVLAFGRDTGITLREALPRAVDAARSAFEHARTAFGDFLGKLREIGGYIETVVAGWGTEIWWESVLPAWLVPAAYAISEAFQRWPGVFAEVKVQVATALETVRTAIQNGLAAAGSFISTHAEEIRTILSAAWGFIVGYIQSQIKFFTGIVQAGLALLRGDWDGAWSYLGDALQAKFGGIIDFITGGTGQIKAAFDGLKPVFDQVIGIVQSLWTVVSEVMTAVVGSVQDSAAVVRANFAEAWQALVGIVTGLVTAIANVISTVLGGVANFVRTHGEEIRGFLAGAWERISSIISLTLQLLDRTIVGAFKNIAGFLSQQGGVIEGALGGVWDVFSRLVDVVLNVVESFLKLPAPVQNTILAIAGIAVAAGPAISAFRTVSSTVSDALVYVRLFGGALKDLPALLAMLVKGSGAWTALTGIGTTLSGLFATVSAVVGPALAAVAAALAPLLPIILAVAAAAVALYLAWKNNFLGFRDLCNEIGAAVSAIFQFVKTVVEGFWQFLTGEISWSAFTSMVSSAFEGLKGQLATIWANIARIVSDAWEEIKRAVSSAAASVATWVTTAWENINVATAKAWEAIKSAISQKAREILDAVLTWLDDTLVKIETFDLRAAAEHFFGTVLPGIAAKIGEALKTVGQWLTSVFNAIRQFDLKAAAEALFGTILPGIAAKVAAALKDVGTFLSDIWKKISGYDLKAAAETSFGTVVSGFAAKIATALTNVGTFLSDAAKKIREHDFKSDTLTAVQTVVAGIIEKAGEILTAVGTFLSDMSKKISEFDLKAAGTALIQGLINGITSMAEQAVSAATGVVQNAIDGAKKLLGIKSPSRVFREIGVQTMAGFALGIENSTASSVRALGSHIKTIVEEMERLANSVIAPAAVASAKAVTDPLKVIFENVAGIIGGLEKLSGLKLPAAVGAQLQAVSDAVVIVTRHLQFMANTLVSPDAVASAKAFSDPIKAIFENVKAVVDGVSALTELIVTDVAPSAIEAAVELLGFVVEQLVRQLSGVAKRTADLGAAAAVFAANAAPVVGLVREAIAAVGGLREAPILRSYDDLMQVQRGIDAIRYVLNELVSRLGSAALLLDEDLQEAARAFAEGVGPVVGLVSSALDALGAIRDARLMTSYEDLIRVSRAVDQIRYVLTEVATRLGSAGAVLGGELLEAARSFAENIKPVLDVVGAGLKALTELNAWEKVPGIPLLIPKMQQLAGFLLQLNIALLWSAQVIGTELQQAARAFAENVKPVLDVVSGGLKALDELNAWEKVPGIPLLIPKMQQLAGFMLQLSIAMLWSAQVIGTELQQAARSFAENIKPVLEVVGAGLKALTELTEWEGRPNVADLLPKLEQLAAFMRDLAAAMQRAASTVGQEMQEAARAFAENVKPVLALVKDGIDALVALTNYKDIDRAQMDALVADIAYVVRKVSEAAMLFSTEGLTQARVFAEAGAAIQKALIEGIKAGANAPGMSDMGGLATAMKGLADATVDATGKILAQFKKLVDAAYNAGYNWAKQLANGIEDGLPLLEAALQAVADLFPHSPAKEGPLRRTPDWQAWMLGGMDRAAGLVADALNTVALPAGYAAALAAPGSSGVTVQVNLSGPVTIREDADLTRLAEAIGVLMGNQASQYQRVNRGWVASR